jgi:energy-coupling factor transporter ATP-binding protein EcfA2/DNA-binding ferritin-like protein
MGLERLDIDFSKCTHTVVVIKGDNGTGKSTIDKALGPLNDNNIEYIPGKSASKVIVYLLDDMSTLSITYTSIVSEATRERRPSHCSILRTFVGQQPIELNPSGNITTGKDIIYELFGLDDNFMMLSQLSANHKGLGGLRPAERKRYVNAIIDTLGAYMDMYKMFSKKSTILKSLLNSITGKLSQIGNIEIIKDLVTKQTVELRELESKRNSLLEQTSVLKAEMDNINKEGDITKRYSLSVSTQKKLESEFAKLPPKKDIEYSPERLSFLEKENAGLEAKLEVYTADLNSQLSDEGNVRNAIRDTEVELASLYDISIANETKEKITKMNDKIGIYQRAFEAIGFKAYEDISQREYNLAVDALDKINNIIIGLGEKYTESDRETAISHLNEAYTEWEDIDKLINALRMKIEKINDDIKDQMRLRDIASDFANIPTDCNHINDCPFITTIVKAKQSMFNDEALKKLEQQRDSTLDKIDQVRIEYERQKQTAGCIAEVRFLVQYIKDMYDLISKFPSTRYLSSLTDIIYHIRELVPIDIDLDKFKEYANYINIIAGLKHDRRILNDKLDKIAATTKTSIILKNNLEKFNEQLETIGRAKVRILAKIGEVKNTKLQNDETILSLTFAKESKEKYDKITSELESNDKEVTQLTKDCRRYYAIMGEYTDKKTVLNNLTMNDIPNITNKIEQNKYRVTMFEQYQKDYAEYERLFNTLQSLRHYTSINGIQTVYMSVFMNSILQTANQLLQLLFSGRFVLQPFIINEEEFKIPCIDSEGNLRSDISLMSDSQLSMISMIISFSLLHKASEIYNIIKLDEVDNNLDNMNRLQFSLLITKIMGALNFHQCIIISHNDEIDLSNVDMILFKIDNPTLLNSLVNSGANIIFNYNK